MKSEVTITRSPIKIRKPILREFCSCWSPNFNVVYVDGVPHYIAVQGNREDVHHLIESVEQSLSFFVSDTNRDFLGVVDEVIGCRLPVKVHLTRGCLSEETVSKMSSIPHSSISIGMTVGQLQVTSELRNVLSTAKDWKVSSSLRVLYAPHLLRKLDLYEAIDRLKNFVSHVEVVYPSYSDNAYQSQLHSEWGDEVVGRFKSIYCPDVTTRSWILKEWSEKSISSGIKEFLAARKISFDVVSAPMKIGNRIKISSKGYSKLPVGMKPFFFHKEDGSFRESQDISYQCPRCHRNLFI